MDFDIKPFNFKLTGQDYGSIDLADALQKGFKTYQGFQEAKITPQKLSEALLAQQLANKYNKVRADYADQSIPADIESKKAYAEQVRGGNYAQNIKNNFLGQREQADIDEMHARSNYYNQGGGRSGVDQKNMNALTQQVALEHPDWDSNKVDNAVSSYLSGSTTSPSGENYPSPSGKVNQYLVNVQGRNAPVAVKNQAANLDVLVSDLKDFDINSVASFAGPKGRAKLTEARIKMVTNPDDPSIDPTARNYISAINQSILNMDQLRKAYGTSVVPDYVYKTMGRLANPNDSMWNDTTQVIKTYQDMVKTVERNRDAYFKKVRGGVTASSGKQDKLIDDNANEGVVDVIRDKNGRYIVQNG